MQRYLFGSENELGLVTESRGSVRPAPTELAPAIVNNLAERCVHLPSAPPHHRIFLANGACAYADVGGHPEIASAECANPIDLAGQIMALREMLVESAKAVGHIYNIPIRLIANNLDYALQGSKTYGYHLNIFSHNLSLERVIDQLTPLLVAMPLVAGAGRVSFASGSSGFELSQRAGFMASVTGKHTTESRAMFTYKDEPLADQGIRIHLICLDTVISPWQLALVPAILALTLRIVETGEDIAQTVNLDNPMKSLRLVSCDPSLSAQLLLKDGGSVSALDIHTHYLTAVRQLLKPNQEPPWVSQMIQLWAEVITNLRKDPFSEFGRLDWVTKLVMFTQELKRMGLDWKEFSRWIYTLGSVRRLKATFPEINLESIGMSTTIHNSALGTLESHFAKNRLSWKDFPQIWKAANRLCQQCLRYHILNSNRTVLPTTNFQSPVSKERVDYLKNSAPEGTRALVRSKVIKSAPPGSTAWWTFVDQGSQRLMMQDPFGLDTQWQDKQPQNTKQETQA